MTCIWFNPQQLCVRICMYLHENILRHEVLNLSSSASGCLQTLSSVMTQNIYLLMSSERSYGTDGKLSDIPLYLCHTNQRRWSIPTRWEECRSKYKIYMHKFNISMSYFLSLFIPTSYSNICLHKCTPFLDNWLNKELPFPALVLSTFGPLE